MQTPPRGPLRAAYGEPTRTVRGVRRDPSDTAGPAINPLIKVMNLVSLLIASAVVSMSVGDDQNDVLRITIALVCVTIVVVAVYISKQREVSMGDDSGTSAAPPDEPTGATDPSHRVHPTEPQPTQRFEAPAPGGYAEQEYEMPPENPPR